MPVVGTMNVENYFPNTIVNHLKGKMWNQLHHSVGTPMLMHLLLHTSLFCSLPNNCYFQVTGVPLADVPNIKGNCMRGVRKRKKHAEPTAHPPSKRRKKLKKKDEPPEPNTEEEEEKPPPPPPPPRKIRPKVFKSAGEVELPRFSLFYKKPRRSPSGKIIYGLSSEHFLKKAQRKDIPIALALHAVFPRQFRAKSAFDLLPRPSANSLGRPATRTPPAKIPWRLKKAKSIFQRMVLLADRCNVAALLDFFCPSKLTEAGAKAAPQAERNATADGADQPMLQYAIREHQVSLFAQCLLGKLVPMEFLGSQKNKTTVCKVVKAFLAMNRFDSISIARFLHGFQVSACAWLVPPNQEVGGGASISDMEKRKQLLEDFLYWVAHDVVLPIIAGCFYVTDSSVHRHKMFYFRQDDWEKLTRPMMCRLGVASYQRIHKWEATHDEYGRPKSFGFLRLLPKDAGVRPILNLRRRVWTKGVYGKQLLPSVNTTLQNLFQALNYENHRDPSMRGSSVFGIPGIYEAIKGFKHRNRGKHQKLYFVKVDVVKCFDNIDQEQVTQIVEKVLREKEYVIKRFAVLSATEAGSSRQFRRKALPSAEFMQFPRMASTLAEGCANTIFTDQVVYSFEEREALIALLKSHIRNNTIKMGRKYFRQVIGIPQGSVISTILCSFFYAHMESEELREFTAAEDLLMRLVDDFLYVTPSLEKASLFAEKMHRGFPQYGCEVNSEKTLVNFPLAVGGRELCRVRGDVFPWCGLNIKTSSMEVTGDFARLLEKPLADSLVVRRTKRPWANLRLKMIHFLKPKFQAIFLDTSLNRRRTVYQTIYSNYALCTIKTCLHVQQLGRTGIPLVDSGFLTACFTSSVHVGLAVMRSRTRNKLAARCRCRFDLSLGEIKR